MTRRIAVVVAACVLVSSFAFAQGKPAGKKEGQPAATAAGMPDKALLQRVLDAWGTMNPDNVAKYYDQAATDVFYDLAPLKYVSFKEYTAGVKQMFATLSALKFTMNDDTVVHPTATLAWTTSTVKVTMTDKAGKVTNPECRWTTIWQKKGGNWVIVHDHFSTPMEPPKQ